MHDLGLDSRDNWQFNMVLEVKVLESNIDFINLLSFKLNIQRVGLHLLKGRLSSHTSENVKLVIK